MSTTTERGANASLRHLRARLGALDAHVRAAVERRRAGIHGPDDPFRGLYVSEEDVDRLLAGPSEPLPAIDGDDVHRIETAAGAGADLRLRRLASSFRLEDVDVELLLIALAPDLDARFERLYGYLHDDVSRRRASVGLALELAGAVLDPARARHRLVAGPLVTGGLVVVEDGERPFLTRSLRVPDRVAMHLLGDDHPDPALAPYLAPVHTCPTGDPGAVGRVLGSGATLVYVREPGTSAGRALAAAALAQAELGTVALDLANVDGADTIVPAALREARLRGAGLVLGPVERLAELDRAALRRVADAGWPVVLTGAKSWDPSWSRTIPVVVELDPPAHDARAQMWRAALSDELPKKMDAASATVSFRLGPEQVERAARAAVLAAALADRPLEARDLQAGARAQNAAGLERLARRIRPRVGWDDLILPERTAAHVREIAERAAQRERVLETWQMGTRRAGDRGIVALFSGESGTGKTMAAEVLAGALGLDLYTIDLATVVDKYIGETEKNLDRIFVEADNVDAVLFFDEADAIFGKRSEVKDAHDRYANVETAYLLQRLEMFDGIAILATNLKSNIDEAFARRLDAVVDFPMPDVEHRRRLWEHCLRPGVPRASKLDLDFCARAFELSGGNIKNIAFAASYLAAARDGRVGMPELMRATAREYRKLGRLCTASEFGPYYDLVAQPD